MVSIHLNRYHLHTCINMLSIQLEMYQLHVCIDIIYTCVCEDQRIRLFLIASDSFFTALFNRMDYVPLIDFSYL